MGRFDTKVLLLLVLLACMVTGSYWLKSRVGINLSRHVSLSSTFPFSLLSGSAVLYPQRDKPFLLAEDFAKPWALYSNWPNLSAQERGELRRSIQPKGVANSRCMVVINAGNGHWIDTSHYLIKVNERDVFHVEALVWAPAAQSSTGFRITTYDEEMQVIKWNQWRQIASVPGVFQLVAVEFVIPSGVAYIRLALIGQGPGESRFDEIKVRKR